MILTSYQIIAMLTLYCVVCIESNVAEETSGVELPTFLSEPDNITVVEGHIAHLECSVNFLHSTQVIAWMKEATFETSGREVLVDDKAIRYTTKTNYFQDHVEYHLDIKNVSLSDAGSYSCYIVEFGEHNRRRWRGSRPASLTITTLWVRPKLRCYEPPVADSDGVVTTTTSVAVGCAIREAQWSRSLELQKDGLSLLTDDAILNKNTSTIRRLRYRIRSTDGEDYVGTFTCAANFTLRDGSVETEHCTIGNVRIRKPVIPITVRVRKPVIPTTPYIPFENYGAENAVWVKDGEDARFNCPPVPSIGKRLAWTIYPPLSPNRYKFQNDGNELSITNVTKNDTGILVTCVMLDEDGRQDIETFLRIGDGREIQYAEQVGVEASKPRPPSSISSSGRHGYNAGRKVVIPDMENPDWQLLASKWNGLRHGMDGDVQRDDFLVDVLDLDIKLPPKRIDISSVHLSTAGNTPESLATTVTTTTATTTEYVTLQQTVTKHQFNESIIIGPPINIRDLLPKEILKSEEGRLTNEPSLFTGLILICGAAMISILLLVLTLGLKCKTKDEKDKPRPSISEPIPLSLPEICNMSDSTYEDMHSNLNAFPAHCTVAGPSVTILGSRYPVAGSSCNSELVFGSNQVDFNVEPIYPPDHIYGGSLTQSNPSDQVYGGSLSPSMNQATALNIDHLPPPDVCYHPHPAYTSNRLYGTYPVHNSDLVYGTDRDYNPSVYGTDPYHPNMVDLERDCLQRSIPDEPCDIDYGTKNPRYPDDLYLAHNSSSGSDPYGFEPLEPAPSSASQRSIPIRSPTVHGQTRISKPVDNTQHEDLDCDYLPPARVSSSCFKGPPSDCSSGQQSPFGLYEVL